MTNTQKKDAQVCVSDLRNMNEAAGLNHHIDSKNPDLVVMDGHWSYQCHSDGLSAHCVQATEQQNISNVSELPPGISCNLVFEGRIDFALGGRRHRLGERVDEGPQCSSIILAQPDIITRHMKKNRRVQKVNIFVQRRWLESRCNNAQEAQQLASIFQHHGQVLHWHASATLISLAQQFIAHIPDTQQLASRLQIEHMAIEMLSVFLNELVDQLSQRSLNPHALQPAPSSQLKLKQQIEQSLKSYSSLPEIAASLGISASTLQRRFKASYGMTVIDYIRQRKLEMARAALTLQGISIGEAAYLAGYNHPSNFVTAFRKRFSVTPAALVKSHRKFI